VFHSAIEEDNGVPPLTNKSPPGGSSFCVDVNRAMHSPRVVCVRPIGSVTINAAGSSNWVVLPSSEEGEFVNGEWHKGRTLGGDDTGQGNSVSPREEGLAILRVTLYQYKQRTVH
jgi:hypothetical protein